MRTPVAALKATTQITSNKAGIIGQQVYLSCAICNAKRSDVWLLGDGGASARQSRFAPDSGVAMNNPPLGGLIDRGNECVQIRRRRISSDGAFTHSANTAQNAPVAQRASLSLACAFGSGFCIGHAIGKQRGERHGCGSICQPCERELSALVS